MAVFKLCLSKRSSYTVAWFLLGLIFPTGLAADPPPSPDNTALITGLDHLADGRLNTARRVFREAADRDAKRLGKVMLTLVEALRKHNKERVPIIAGRSYFLAVGGLWNQIQNYQLTPRIRALLPEIRSRLAAAEPGANPALRVLLCNLRMLSDERSSDGEAVFHVEAEVERPQRLLAPVAQYTHAARKDRVNGVVISQIIIDSEGCVVSAKILKGLPKGLNDSVRKAHLWWVYEPARVADVPVTVYYNVTTRFGLK